MSQNMVSNRIILDMSILITAFHSCDALRCPTIISKGRGGDSEVVDEILSSRTIAKLVFEPRLIVRRAAVRNHAAIIPLPDN